MKGMARPKSDRRRRGLDDHAAPFVETSGAIVVDCDVQNDASCIRGGCSRLGMVEESRSNPPSAELLSDGDCLEVPIPVANTIHELEEWPGQQPRSQHAHSPKPGSPEKRTIL